jgi:DNA-binding transcriptional regulator PaaX
MYHIVQLCAIMATRATATVQESTRTLLFGVFVLAGRPLTAAQVIRLTAPLGISATNVKSHLTRMVAEGALDRRGPVRSREYAPSATQSSVVEGIRARLRATSDEVWDGSWLSLSLGLPARRGARGRLTASLWFDGFRPWAPGTFVRPAWPEGWALGRARHYLTHAAGFCLRGRFIEELDLERVATLYGLDELDREARALARWIGSRQTTAEAGEQTLAARLVVGGRVARLAGHDPRLPAQLWGQRRGMRDLVRAFGRFEARMEPRARKFLDRVINESSL